MKSPPRLPSRLLPVSSSALPIEALSLEDGAATCGVRKDGGDDEDATDGLLICARVGYREADGVAVEGGLG